MLGRVRAAIPPAILATAALWLAYGALGVARLSATRGPEYRWARYELLYNGLWVGLGLLMTLGLRELATRLPRHARALALVAMGCMAVEIVRTAVVLYLTYVDPPSLSWMMRYWRWDQRVYATAMLVATTCLAIAAGMVAGRRGAIVGGFAVVASLVFNHYEFATDWLFFEHRRQHEWGNFLLRFTYGAAFHGALVALAWVMSPRLAPQPAAEHRTARALEQAGSAMVGRVLLALGGAVFTLMAVGAKSIGLMKAILLLVPLGVVIATVVQLVAMFRIAADGDGPRWRATAAAALATITSIVTAIQAFAVYRAITVRRGVEESLSHRDYEVIATAWPYLLPLAGLAAMLIFISAIADLRKRRPVLDSAAPGIAATLQVIGVLGVMFLGQVRAKSQGEFLLLTVAVAAANITALLAVARLCHKTSWALQLFREPELPAARVVSDDRNSM